MYVVKQPVTELLHFTIHLDHKNPHYLLAKQIVTLEDLHSNKILLNTSVFRHIAPKKIAMIGSGVRKNGDHSRRTATIRFYLLSSRQLFSTPKILTLTHR